MIESDFCPISEIMAELVWLATESHVFNSSSQLFTPSFSFSEFLAFYVVLLTLYV